MNKKCAKCGKTVYPVEELKCLEKVWHKTCFKCEVCGMILNMKNYKGFNKLPYCGAHVPKAKATVVADTPENLRLAENSKVQSNVKYHADFEATKGKFTQIADDPETLRIKANTDVISNITYHDVKGHRDDMEKKRSLQGGGENVKEAVETVPAELRGGGGSQDQHRASQDHGRAPVPQHEEKRMLPPEQQMRMSADYGGGGGGRNEQQRPSQDRTGHEPFVRPAAVQEHGRNSQDYGNRQQPQQQQPSYSAVNQPSARSTPANSNRNQPPPYANPPQQHSQSHLQMQQQQQLRQQQLMKQQQLQQEQQLRQQQYQQQQIQLQQQQQMQQQQQQYNQQQQQQLRQMSEHGHKGSYQNQAPTGYGMQQPQQQKSSNHHPTSQQYQDHRRISANQQQQQKLQQQQQLQLQQQQQQLQQQQMYKQQQGKTQSAGAPAPAQTRGPSNRCYQAMYDYEAQDTDEVSFKDGDIVINAVFIDEGWMTGTVHRTGQSGMLPANYVEPVNL